MADYGSSAAPTADAERERQLDIWMQERATDPRVYYAELRKKCPVDLEQHRDSIAVLDRTDIEEVLRNTDLFSNEQEIMGSAEPVIPLGVDPPLHSMYRRILDPLFSPKKMAALQPKVAAHVNEFIDGFIDDGEVDFSTALAVPLVCLTFLSLLGLPTEELDAMVHWKDIMIRPEIVAGSREAGMELQAKTVSEIYMRFAQEIEARRDAPRDDLISYFMTAEVDDGRRLTDGEILRILFLLLAAGLDTVTISLQAIFNHLATHPEAQQMIHDDPSQIDNVIEELLRWETPVMGTSRVAKVDTELAGCPIPAGTKVMVAFASGNVHEEFPESLTLDLARGDKAHLSFGGGNHRCLGSHLARMELRTVLREWHKRIPFYELKPGTEIVWVPSGLRGIDYLPLQWQIAVK
ncbi:MAG TPA: cytochrome P450 [Actinobacteria bacterium]|nr:cytochrome P450 [Actinomycetota bacterium]